MTENFPWGIAISFIFIALIIMSIAILGINHDLIEGEVLGKEPRQAAFFAGTPNYLIINGTGKVVVDVELYHGYEIGEWFSEEIPWSSFGNGREISGLLTFGLIVGIIMLVLSLFGCMIERIW